MARACLWGRVLERGLPGHQLQELGSIGWHDAIDWPTTDDYPDHARAESHRCSDLRPTSLAFRADGKRRLEHSRAQPGWQSLADTAYGRHGTGRCRQHVDSTCEKFMCRAIDQSPYGLFVIVILMRRAQERHRQRRWPQLGTLEQSAKAGFGACHH